MPRVNGEAASATSTRPHLRVCVGTTVTSCARLVAVNDDARPVVLDSPLATMRIVVRVRNFVPDERASEADAGNGVDDEDESRGSPGVANPPYWKVVDKRRLFSIQVQARFKQEFSGEDLLYGNFWLHRVYQPPLIWIPLKLATVIDPGFTHDLGGERPWALSPAVSSISVLEVKSAPDPAADGGKAAAQANDVYDGILGRWEWKDGVDLQENHALLWRGMGDRSERLLGSASGHDVASVAARRKVVKHREKRAEIAFSKDLVYNMEFYAPFVDLNRFELNMGGITLGLSSYLGHQPFFFGMKSQSLGETLFCVKFELV
ncbi:hypothetical protein HK405_009379 [Cladochytrium tenue]|nr:hypothetical protein HK405_009379 [Cladochytrium tenue]